MAHAPFYEAGASATGRREVHVVGAVDHWWLVVNDPDVHLALDGVPVIIHRCDDDDIIAKFVRAPGELVGSRGDLVLLDKRPACGGWHVDLLQRGDPST